MSAITSAMVLAAGLGTRMRTLNNGLPKPLVPLAGQALIDHVLDRLAAAGVERAVVNVHYMADLIETHLAGRRRPHISISDERGALLDTGGGVARALDKLGPGAFFIHNSDSVWIEGPRPCLERMGSAWTPDVMDALLLLAPAASALGYEGDGDFTMDPDGRVRRWGRDGGASFVFTGVSIAHPRLFDGAPGGKFSLNLVWDRAMERGRAYGLRHEGVWMHVGTPGALHDAEERLRHERT